jgi:two-component system chemotaxis sensor kinase CheA
MSEQEEMEEVIKEFLTESFENLDKLDQDLVALESTPDSKDILNRIFRIIHTIKGTSGFFGFSKLESIAHLGENLLDGLRSGRIQSTTEITTALLSTVDAVREILTSVHHGAGEGATSYDSLIATLRKLTSTTPKNAGPDILITPQSAASTPQVQAPVVKIESLTPIMTTAPVVEVPVAVAPVIENVVSPEAANPIVTASPVAQEKISTPVILEKEVKSSSDLPKIPAAPTTEHDHKISQGVIETSLRVDVHLIDDLMNLVSELVLARNQILQFSRSINDSGLVTTTQRLNVITTELQESVMRTRMQPIENVWNKFPRVIRDVAQACKKEARIEMEGKHTELDKTIIEAIKDPLTHIIRNSVDHGLETPEVRRSKGKDPVGTVKLKAFHEGGYVIIEIIDDGAGLNIPRIKSKAVEKGLLTKDYAEKMSEREAAKLIFAAGFSTAEKVTKISGRGVGMDVVRSNIERIGGIVDVLTVADLGTTIRIKIPLTLAIVPALVVIASGQRFAIPQVSLVELVRIPVEKIESEIERIGEANFYRLRGRLMPLIYLNQTLGMSSTKNNSFSSLNIVFVQVDGRQFGIIVDSVCDTEEIVVKPLSRQLKEIPVYAGAAIMGDGKIALIIDVAGLSKHSEIFANQDTDSARNKSAEDSDAKKQVKRRLLVVKVGESSRVAIPVERLNRLEEFDTDSFESASGHLCVQYRENILPLIDMARFLGRSSSERQGIMKAVIIDNNVHRIGLLVDGIIDIVEEAISLTKVSVGNGIVGSAIISGHVTDFLDLGAVFASVSVDLENKSDSAGV